VGEALISFLDEKGRPSVTERVFVRPPGSQIGPITPEQRKTLLATSLVAGVYEKAVDRDSAYEKLKGRAVLSSNASASTSADAANTGAAANAGAGSQTMPTGTAMPAQPGAPSVLGGIADGLKGAIFGTTGPRGGHYAGLAEKAASSAVRSIGSAVGRELIRGVLGSLLGGKR